MATGEEAAATRDAVQAATDRAAAIPTTTKMDPAPMGVDPMVVGEVEAAGRAMAATGLVVAEATAVGPAEAVEATAEVAAGRTEEERAATAVGAIPMEETAAMASTTTDIEQQHKPPIIP